MANERNHISLANKNHDALCYLLKVDDHPEWVATVAFYKALQLTELLFRSQKCRAHDHTTRNRLIKSKFPSIYPHYRVLWVASTIARYLHDHDSKKGYESFSKFMSIKEVREELITKRLLELENGVIGLVGDKSLTTNLKRSLDFSLSSIHTSTT